MKLANATGHTRNQALHRVLRLAKMAVGALAVPAACLLASGLPLRSEAQPSAAAPFPTSARPPDSNLSTDDLRFIDEVALASAMEIQAAEMALALQVSGDPAVLAYARLMLKDHRALAASWRS